MNLRLREGVVGPKVEQRGKNSAGPQGSPHLGPWSPLLHVMSRTPGIKVPKWCRRARAKKKQTQTLFGRGQHSLQGACVVCRYLIKHYFRFSFSSYYKNMHALCRKFKNTDKQTEEN